jgi:hypothetical protein
MSFNYCAEGQIVFTKHLLDSVDIALRIYDQRCFPIVGDVATIAKCWGIKANYVE